MSFSHLPNLENSLVDSGLELPGDWSVIKKMGMDKESCAFSPWFQARMGMFRVSLVHFLPGLRSSYTEGIDASPSCVCLPSWAVFRVHCPDP